MSRIRTPAAPLLALSLAALIVAGCSQRATPEDEYARTPDDRPTLPASAAPPALVQGPGAMTPGGASAGAGAEADESADVRGTIALADGAAPPPSGVLFLFVRAVGQTSGPPLAVQRLAVGSFPLPFEIGPGDAMIPGTTFPEQITVEARIDADGNAMSRGPGDLSARSQPIAPGSEGVQLVLAPG